MLAIRSGIAMVLPANKLFVDFLSSVVRSEIVIDFERSILVISMNINIAYKR
jgi:hypothetical protein